MKNNNKNETLNNSDNQNSNNDMNNNIINYSVPNILSIKNTNGNNNIVIAKKWINCPKYEVNGNDNDDISSDIIIENSLVLNKKMKVNIILGKNMDVSQENKNKELENDEKDIKENAIQEDDDKNDSQYEEEEKMKIWVKNKMIRKMNNN